MERVTGRTVIVTDGGIDGAVCRCFTVEGAKVTILDLSLDAMGEKIRARPREHPSCLRVPPPHTI